MRAERVLAYFLMLGSCNRLNEYFLFGFGLSLVEEATREFKLWSQGHRADDEKDAYIVNARTSVNPKLTKSDIRGWMFCRNSVAKCWISFPKLSTA